MYFLAAAAVATGNAQQSLEAMRQQANAVNVASSVASVNMSNSSLMSSQPSKSHKSSEEDLAEISVTTTSSSSSSKESPKGASTSGAYQQQPTFKINDVCLPGNTLLWDLLQDDKIVSFP